MRQASAFDAGLDELFDMGRHQMQASQIAAQSLLQTMAREVVRDAEAVQIEAEDALLG